MSVAEEWLLGRFGPDGVRRFGPTAGPNQTPAVSRVAGIVAPVRVGPYFGTAGHEPVALREYAESVRVSLHQSQVDWARLGFDGGYEICVSPDGVVRALLLGGTETRFVNSSPEALVRGLVELDQALAAIHAAEEPARAAGVFRELVNRLGNIDPQAFAERESWWSLVLDDIKDTSSAESYAAFEVVNADGEKNILTQAGGICVHAEEKLWSSLSSAGVGPEQVTRVHTELEPCLMPGHYCALWMARVFPHAEFTHNFSYGETAASRAEGIRQLRENAAQN